MEPRWITADNPGPFTLDGTRTFFVGERQLAIIDPGPEDAGHAVALTEVAGTAEEVVILLTHGHRDHSGGVKALAESTGAAVRGVGHAMAEPLADGDVIRTDHGELIAVDTPGHAERHISFHWPARHAAFVGDLMLGQGDTTWVAEYPGCVADYLRSLDRVRDLGCRMLYPSHGPAITDVAAGIDRYEMHRRERIAQVVHALAEKPGASVDELLEAVYGDGVSARMMPAARLSVQAILDFVHGEPA